MTTKHNDKKKKLIHIYISGLPSGWSEIGFLLACVFFFKRPYLLKLPQTEESKLKPAFDTSSVRDEGMDDTCYRLITA